MHDAKHPIWPIIRLAVVLTGLTGVLWLTARHFDETEIRTIVTMFLVAAGAEGIAPLISRFTGH